MQVGELIEEAEKVAMMIADHMETGEECSCDLCLRYRNLIDRISARRTTPLLSLVGREQGVRR